MAGRRTRSIPPVCIARVSGVALIGAMALAGLTAPSASGHPSSAPVPESETLPSLIPPGDIPRYRSEVTGISPPVPRLELRIVGTQDRLEATWLGAEPLVIEGVGGEPMIRMSVRGVSINALSPYAYKSGERFGRADPPAEADPDAPPVWNKIAPPGPISWYEHRAQWMRAERPSVVGDGASATLIRNWEVPATLGGRELSITGVLEWVPEPQAVRDKASEVSSPALSALILTGALVLGALIGARVRDTRGVRRLRTSVDTGSG